MANICISDLSSISSSQPYDCLEALSCQEQSKVSGGAIASYTNYDTGATDHDYAYTFGGLNIAFGSETAPSQAGSTFKIFTL
jgi:hypothetical protein